MEMQAILMENAKLIERAEECEKRTEECEKRTEECEERTEEWKQQAEELKDLVAALTERIQQLEPETEEKEAKRRKIDIDLKLLKENNLPPSSARWDVLERGGIVEVWQDFFLRLRSLEITATEELLKGVTPCNLEALQMIKAVNVVIANNSLPENVGYPTILCGNIIAHVANELNGGLAKCKYWFRILPVILPHPENHRTDKKADYVLVKIQNKRSLVVCVLKLMVPCDVTSENHKELAQLFLEAYNCHQHDSSKGMKYEQLLCILASHEHWHFFLVDVTRIPLKVITYYKSKSKPEENIICETIRSFINTMQ